MKKSVLLLFIFFVALIVWIYIKFPPKRIVYPSMANYTGQQAPRTKKKIVIFTGKGGRGHLSAQQALCEYLGDIYDIESVCPIEEVLGELDFIYTMTLGNFYSEQFYNYCLTNHYIWMVDAMVWLGLQAFDHKRARITHLIYDYLKEKNPDLVISVIPVVNSATIDATELLGIPFWVIPTDLDPVVFLHGIDTPESTQFFFNVPYKMPELYDHLAPAHIPDTQITYAGFPVRKQFLQTYDKTLIRQQYAIPEQVPVIMLMMGGLGLEDTVHFARELTKISGPAHCLLCIGKNENLRGRLERIVDKAPSITYSIIGFTPDIAQLMAISDLLITKSGGATINEALYLGVPMIIDGSSTAPHWEYYNRTFIANTGCGILLKKIKKLSTIVEQILADPAMLAEMKDAIQHIPKLDPCEAVCAQVALLLSQQKR